ncbi:MAG: hypothetical protein Q9221_003132 [Calogaya cf. arnoldii]
MSSQTLHPLLPNPLTAFILSLTQCVLVLGFTSRDSPLRTLGLAPILAYVYLALHASRIHNDNTNQLYLNTLTGSTASIALQYLDSALLSRWAYTARGPTSGLGGQKSLRDGKIGQHRPVTTTFTSRLVFGWEETFRARSARSPWEVKNVPSFDPKRPHAVPTKAQFLRWAALRCLVSFFLVDLVSYLGRDASMNVVYFAHSKIPVFTRWHHVTAEELILRSFWHQGARQKFRAPAHFVTFSVFKFQSGTLLARYTILLFTFITSGIIHQLGDMASGVPMRQAGAVRFFALQAIGIMLEDTALGILRWINGWQRTQARPTGWKVVFGFCWLLAWLTWTTPVWVYPQAQRSSGASVLPFSILR